MSNKKVRVINNKDQFKKLASTYEGVRSQHSKMQSDLYYAYLPSAISVALNNGNKTQPNKTRQVLVATKAISKNAPLLDPLVCLPFSKKQGKFVSVKEYASEIEQDPEQTSLTSLQIAKLTEKYKSKRKQLLSIDRESGEPVWLVKYKKKLESLERNNEKNKNRSFDQDLLSIVTRIANMAQRKDAEDSQEIQQLAELATELRPSIESKVQQAKEQAA